MRSELSVQAGLLKDPQSKGASSEAKLDASPAAANRPAIVYLLRKATARISSSHTGVSQSPSCVTPDQQVAKLVKAYLYQAKPCGHYFSGCHII